MKQYIKQTETGIRFFRNPLKAGNGDTIYNPPHERLLAEGWVEYTPTLEEAREAKLAELEAAFDTTSREAHCTSSVGFEIDADETANRNIEGLVLVMQPEKTTLFRAYDNTFHEVTREQLETMRKEIVVNSQYLYQAKWTMEAQIQAAETAEALDTIIITAEALAELADSLKASAGETEEATEDTAGEKEHVKTT